MTVAKIKRHFTIGNLITLVLAAAGVVASYSTLQAQVAQNTRTIERNPPARTAVVEEGLKRLTDEVHGQRQDIRILSKQILRLSQQMSREDTRNP